ncbi:thioredoxin-disulfide reductase [Candidatus Bathyarchaeota archaeon]|nr:thioredoxin-disulfide reductase [Candidatus Bathyarchaeota archaeon]
MYDIIVVGGGPAGITAGIYARRAGYRTLLFERNALGGQAATAEVIENYPGILEISGIELAQRYQEQADKYGLEVKIVEVTKVYTEGERKIVETKEGTYETNAVIVASGADPQRLGIRGEDKFVGRGVSFCATCDGLFFKGKNVAVIGGGDSAVTEALFLSKIVNKVYVIHRRDTLRAEKINQEKALANSKIEFVLNSVVEEIIGENKVEKLVVKNLNTGERQKLEVVGVFVYVGRKPNTGFINVEKREQGYIKIDENMETSMKGIFAAGDCTSPRWRQLTTAVGEGAMAAMSAEKYLEGVKLSSEKMFLT